MKKHQSVGDDRVCLAWVLVDGALRHVSEFAKLEPKLRPKPTCAVCSRTVVLRLGEVRAYHAAHRKGAICPTTNPEYALYFNCKVHIGKALEKASKLSIGLKCRKKHCYRRRTVDWVTDWDRVEIVTAEGSTKPDVTLFRGDEAVASIDVAVSRTLDVDKGAARKLNPIPWVVVRTSKELYQRVLSWTPASALDVEAGVSEMKECGECVREREREAKRVAAAKAHQEGARQIRGTVRSLREGWLEQERLASVKARREESRQTQVRTRARSEHAWDVTEAASYIRSDALHAQKNAGLTREHARHFRIVDFYHSDGTPLRRVFSTHAVTQGERTVEIQLRANGRTLAHVLFRSQQQILKSMKRAFKRVVEELRADSIVDFPTPWRDAEEADLARAAQQVERRYRWEPLEGAWRAASKDGGGSGE